MYSLMYATQSIVILTSVFSLLVLFFIFRAKRGKKPKIRKIPGLEAIESAVGRATEMGRPIMFTPGLVGIDPVCMASMAILKSIVKSAAKYDTRVLVSIFSPEVIPYAEEVVRQGYTEGGKPHLFSPDDIRFISQDQFAYASGTVGLMHREKVAANFMMGAFAAESLILAETGQQIGAIQVAGTISYSQLPFFITTCDYTIIGEEFFAGSAYLTQDPVLLGSLFGQDLAKLVILAILLIGIVYSTTMGLDGKIRPITRNPFFQQILGIDEAHLRDHYRTHIQTLTADVRNYTIQIKQSTDRLELMRNKERLSAESSRLQSKIKEQEAQIVLLQGRSEGNMRQMIAMAENRLETLRQDKSDLDHPDKVSEMIGILKSNIEEYGEQVRLRNIEQALLVGDVAALEDGLKPQFQDKAREQQRRVEEMEREIINLELVK